MPKSFVELLREQIKLESDNYYSDNYDHNAFGDDISFRRGAIDCVKRFLYGGPLLRLIASNDLLFRKLFLGVMRGYDRFMDALDYFYRRLADASSKELLLKLIAYRVLGHVKVRLPLSTPDYWAGLNVIKRLRDQQDVVTRDYKPWRLYRHEISVAGSTVTLYLNSKGIYTTFGLQHYRHQGDDGTVIGVSPGDVVLDLGGCYGDTALYFSAHAGDRGHVFTFEFIPKNLEIMRKNLELNPLLSRRITIVERALWDQSGKLVYFSDRGAGSRVEFEAFGGHDGSCTTISVDDFVKSKGLERVDFLKTDIEGAEQFAIAGAVETLRRFRPKLAISIYHNMNDFVQIIRQVDEMHLGYTFYLGHATIYSAETVLFCQASDAALGRSSSRPQI